MARKKKRVKLRSSQRQLPPRKMPEIPPAPVEVQKPQKSLRHKVRKPLLLLIASLVVILVAGTWYFTYQYEPLIRENQGGPFFVDHSFLKVLLTEADSAQREIQIANTHNTAQVFQLEVEGLTGVVTLDSTLFTLEPAQTKVVNLGFSAFNQDEGIKQGLGVHLGELRVSTNKEKKRIPLIVEVESVDVKFDANLHPLTIGRDIAAGEEANIEVRLFDLSGNDVQNVQMVYEVEDVKGNNLFTESETVVVQGQTSLVKTIPIPGRAKEGFYVFKSISRVGDSIGTTSYVFEVFDPKRGSPSRLIGFCKEDGFCITLSLTFTLLVLLVMIYFILFFGVLIWFRMVRMITLSPEKRWELEEEERMWHLKEQEWKEQRAEKEEKRKIELKHLRFEMKEKEKLERLRLQLEQKKLREKERIDLEEQRRRLRGEHPPKMWNRFVNVQKKNQATVDEKIKQEQAKLKKDLNIKEPPLLVRWGLMKTDEEKKRIRDEKERKKQEKIELKKKKEFEKKKIAETKRLAEEQKRLEVEQLRKKEEQKKLREESKKKKEEEQRQKAEEAQKKREERVQKAAEKKRLRQDEEKKQEELALLEKARQQKEELKKAEEERKQKKLRRPLFSLHKKVNEEVLKRAKGKSKIFKKHLECYHQALDHSKQGNHKEAKKHYVRARQHYLDMEYEEKKEVYKDLDKLYKELKKKE